MYYEAFSPSPVLKPYISSYFYIRVASGRFHFPADGCPGFIINLGDPFLLGFEENQLEIFTGCRLFGSSTRYLMTEHITGRTELLAVKYRPGQLPRFFKLPAMELTDASVSLSTLCGKPGRELEDKLCETGDIPHLVGLLDDALMACFCGDHAFDPRITLALDTISRLKGQVRIEDLAGELGLSRRHFERRFLSAVGLTPKRMCRISRFLNVFSSLQAHHVPNWADLAIAGGYSDQAHMIRECKYFTGHTPLPYLEGRSPLEHAVLGNRNDDRSHFFNTREGSSVMMPSPVHAAPVQTKEKFK